MDAPISIQTITIRTERAQAKEVLAIRLVARHNHHLGIQERVAEVAEVDPLEGRPVLEDLVGLEDLEALVDPAVRPTYTT